jgi:hypothetical protein
VSDPRSPGDVAAIGGGALVLYANHAELLVPIFTAAFLLLSIFWLLWRMFDRLRHGPNLKDSDNGE